MHDELINYKYLQVSCQYHLNILNAVNKGEILRISIIE